MRIETEKSIDNRPTHSVLVGFIDQYTWKTEFCVPCFSEEEAISYQKKCEKYYDDQRCRAIVIELD